MDELVDHCLRELAFDGDLGCTPSRLQEIVDAFWRRNNTSSQSTDACYLDLVWRVLVLHPDVVVGTVLDGAIDVYVAPQRSSKKDKSSKKQETELDTSPQLLQIDQTELDSKTQSDLAAHYGDTLRMAVKPALILSTISGFHTRPNKLSGMVYTCLQLVTREREKGISVVDIGQKTGYDQKTCFYLVKQLLELDLVLKLRRPGVGTNFVLHKYFYNQSETWQGILERTETTDNPFPDDLEPMDDQDGQFSSTFSSIDARHLTSLQLIQSRVTKLLESAENKTYPLNQSLSAIGFQNPNKTQVRFYRSRLRELEQEGIIEIISEAKNFRTGMFFVRLCSPVVADQATRSVGLAVAARRDDEFKLPVPYNNSFQRLVIEAVDRHGTRGTTLGDISKELGNIDKRSIELLMTHLDRASPGAHAQHMMLVDVMETHARMHRHRYFTLRFYRELVEKEGISGADQRFLTADLNRAGEFYSDNVHGDFYQQQRELFTKVNNLEPGDDVTQDAKSRKRKRIEDAPEPGDDVTQDAKSRKRMRDEDTPKKKRGRPPKRSKLSEDATQSQSTVLNMEGPKKRGRPRKNPLPTEVPIAVQENSEPRSVHPIQHVESPPPEIPLVQTAPQTPPRVSPTPQKRRGRPRKRPRIDGNTDDAPLPTAPKIILPPDERNSGNDDQDVVAVEPKIPLGDSPSLPTPGKGTSSARNHNITHIRRRNEFMMLVREAGVALEITTKQFPATHLALLNRLSEAGEVTSAPPGTEIDRRTITTTFDQLEASGLIKSITAILPGQIGHKKTSKFVYDVSKYSLQEVREYLGLLSRGDTVDTQASPREAPEGRVSLHTFEENDHTLVCADKGISKDFLDQQRELLLQEQQALSQWNGTPSGKWYRAKLLHLRIMQQFSSGKDCRAIVSSEPKIVHISFFWTQTTLAEYCSLVPHHKFIPGLRQFLQTRPDMSIADIPPELQLEVGQARARSKITTLLKLLSFLGLATALAPTNENPSLVLQRAGGYPKNYLEIADAGSSCPHYWKIEDSAPLISFRDEPPVRVGSIDVVANPHGYWDRAKLLAVTDAVGEVIPLASTQDPPVQLERLSEPLVNSIRRDRSWGCEYVLNLRQIVFLRTFISPEGAILNDALSPEVLGILADTAFAPLEVISSWLVDHSRHRQELYRETVGSNSIEHRQNQSAKRDARRKTQRVLADKAAAAKRRKINEWDDLVQHAYPGQLDAGMQFRLEPLRNKYMTGTIVTGAAQWRHDIVQAISGQVPIPAGLKRIGERRPAVHFRLSVPALSKSVDELVAELAVNKPRQPNGKNAEEGGGRRQRFQWNKEFDDLALDASVIVRSRCRNLTRMEWGAVQQIFVNLPRNSVRQRVSSIRQDQTVESYLSRLEDKWHELWLDDRGTNALPDHNPDSATDFPLLEHIKYLRDNIDKNALRTGTNDAEQCNFVLPRNIKELSAAHASSLSLKSTSKWDILWQPGKDDIREKAFNWEPFLTTDALDSDDICVNDELRRAEAALKMLIATTSERYDSEAGAQFLRHLAEEDYVSKATESLLDSGVFTKTQHEAGRLRPGRPFRLSDANANALEGPMSKEIFEDFVSMRDRLEVEREAHWDGLASEGEVACFLELISENMVELEMDTSAPAAARIEIDWNSKKADDNHLELALVVKAKQATFLQRYVQLSESRLLRDSSFDESSTIEDKGHLHDSAKSFCDLQSNGIVTCPPCLQTHIAKLSVGMSPKKSDLLKSVYRRVEEMGPVGMTVEELKELVLTSGSIELSVECLQMLVGATPPLLLRVGYGELIVVTANHVAKRGVILEVDGICNLVLPRRWIDIGGHVGDGWRLANLALLGTIFARPGITLHDLRHRLKFVYDRQEVDDVVEELQRKGVVKFAAWKEHPNLPDWLTRPADCSLIANTGAMWSFLY